MVLLYFQLWYFVWSWFKHIQMRQKYCVDSSVFLSLPFIWTHFRWEYDMMTSLDDFQQPVFPVRLTCSIWRCDAYHYSFDMFLLFQTQRLGDPHISSWNTISLTLLFISGCWFCNFLKINCFVGSFFTGNATEPPLVESHLKQSVMTAREQDVIYPIIVILLECRALLDTGAGSSYISLELASCLEQNPLRIDHKQIQTASYNSHYIQWLGDSHINSWSTISLTLPFFSDRWFFNFLEISCFVGSFFTKNAMVLHPLPLTCLKYPFLLRLKGNLLAS